MLLARDTQPLSLSHLRSNEALTIIDQFRGAMGEKFSVEPLEVEFPYEAHWLGSPDVLFADAANNKAGTFKWRGALFAAFVLRELGMTTAETVSAGNHAKGLVTADHLLNLQTRLTLPSTAPPQKSSDLKGEGVTITIGGPNFDDCLELVDIHKPGFIHPYDNKFVIAGQGTIVDDILRAQPDIQHIIVPVGGGGLISGILDRLAQLGRSDILVHGAEAPGSNSLSRSLERGRIVAAEAPNVNYGGSAVRKIGRRTLTLCEKHRSNLHIHSDITEQMVNGVIGTYQQGREDLWRQNTPNFEPTSLVALAALEAVLRDHPQGKIVVVGTGRNAGLEPIRAKTYHTKVWK